MASLRSWRLVVAARLPGWKIGWLEIGWLETALAPTGGKVTWLWGQHVQRVSFVLASYAILVVRVSLGKMLAFGIICLALE